MLVSTLIMDTGLLKQGEGKTNRAANIKSSHDHPLPLLFLHHLPPQVWGCCTYLQKTGVSHILPIYKCMEPSQLRGCILLLTPCGSMKKWYSPASESACCYGNTSHPACSHPTLLPVSWQRWHKKRATKTTLRIKRKTEERKRNDAQTETHLYIDDMLFK